MIRVDSFGPKVPRMVQAEVLTAQKQIALGKLQPFRARDAVFDNEGHEVIAAGQSLSDEQILGMNWLVAGVQGKISH